IAESISIRIGVRSGVVSGKSLIRDPVYISTIRAWTRIDGVALMMKNSVGQQPTIRKRHTREVVIRLAGSRIIESVRHRIGSRRKRLKYDRQIHAREIRFAVEANQIVHRGLVQVEVQHRLSGRIEADIVESESPHRSAHIR